MAAAGGLAVLAIFGGRSSGRYLQSVKDAGLQIHKPLFLQPKARSFFFPPEADSRIPLTEQDAFLVAVKDGKVIAELPNTSHKNFAERNGLIQPGQEPIASNLPPNTWIGTVAADPATGQLFPINSMTFYGNQSIGPGSAFSALSAQFRFVPRHYLNNPDAAPAGFWVAPQTPPASPSTP